MDPRQNPILQETGQVERPHLLFLPTHHGHFWVTSTSSLSPRVKSPLLQPAYLESKFSEWKDAVISKALETELRITRIHKQSCHGSKTTCYWEGNTVREVTYPGGGGIKKGLDSHMNPHHFGNKAKWGQVQPCSELSKKDSQEFEPASSPAQQYE